MSWEPEVRDFHYSASHGGWFWTVVAKNPAPSRMPDGTPSELDGELWDSGYAPRKRAAERGVKRAKRRMARTIQRAHKEMAR